MTQPLCQTMKMVDIALIILQSETRIIQIFFWMVPVSSRFNKFRSVYQHHIERYGKCTKIVLGKCDGRNAAFLIQNAFPITPDFFDHVHTSNGKPLTLHGTTGRIIVECLKNNIRLHKCGINLFFADIDRIYQLMLTHLEN